MGAGEDGPIAASPVAADGADKDAATPIKTENHKKEANSDVSCHSYTFGTKLALDYRISDVACRNLSRAQNGLIQLYQVSGECNLFAIPSIG